MTFGAQVKGVRAVDYDRRPFALYTTLFLRPDLGSDASVLGFNYTIGDRLPGLDAPWAAGESETNLRRPRAEGIFSGERCSWRIPGLADGRFQNAGQSYTVTRRDVIEFVTKARWLRLCGAGIDRPFVEIVPRTRRVSAYIWDRTLPVLGGWTLVRGLADEIEVDAIGGWGQESTLLPRELPISRMEKFWVEVRFEEGASPKFGGVVPLVFVIDGEQMLQEGV